MRFSIKFIYDYMYSFAIQDTNTVKNVDKNFNIHIKI